MTGIRAVALDVDGVLTDGTVRVEGSGNESKSISFTDIMGVSLGRRAGLRFALISGEGGPVFDVIAAKLGITETFPACKDKAAALRSFAERQSLDLDQVCFMGDDVNDLGAMQIAGLAAAPADAHRVVRSIAQFVTTSGGGRGAVRELIDSLLSMEPERPEQPRRVDEVSPQRP